MVIMVCEGAFDMGSLRGRLSFDLRRERETRGRNYYYLYI